MAVIPKNWPSAALPRRLDISQAAYYVGLSRSTFAARVEAGAFPPPIRDGGRVLWDRLALDAALDGAEPLDADDGIDKAEEARALAAIAGG